MKRVDDIEVRVVEKLLLFSHRDSVGNIANLRQVIIDWWNIRGSDSYTGVPLGEVARLLAEDLKPCGKTS